MLDRYYTLDDRGEPIKSNVEDFSDEPFKNPLREVGKDYIGKTLVSTVFLVIDHSHNGGPPILWETMVFNEDDETLDEHHEYQVRCTGSRADALKMHHDTVEMIRSATPDIGSICKCLETLPDT